MRTIKRPASLTGFYLLLVYVLLQFSWWTYLMLNLNAEITRLKMEQVLLKSGSVEQTLETGKNLQTLLNKQRFMVIGEGTVFLALLFFGAYRVRNTFKRDAELALQQSNFLLSITHELKSPIASTRVQLETLLLRELDKVKQKEILLNAISDTDRLNVLVENILLAAQIDKNNFVLNKEHVNLSDFLNKLLASIKVGSNNTLNTVIQPDIFFTIDKVYFASILINLIENASKYSVEKSTIGVTLNEIGNTIELCVSDEGYGIPAEEKQKIFEKFYRIGDENVRATKGTGLGLYIVKYLVEEHEGKITVLDNKPKGTVFQIEFGSR